MPAPVLAELAAEIFGAERVRVAPRLDDAIETAINLAETDNVGAPGILITGSVVAVGEARTLLVSDEQAPVPETATDPDDDWDADDSENGQEPDRELWT
jgi:dihydrofolate synthase/folylpolyglutamate synthase